MEAGNPAGDAAADARLLKLKRLETSGSGVGTAQFVNRVLDDQFGIGAADIDLLGKGRNGRDLGLAIALQ